MNENVSLDDLAHLGELIGDPYEDRLIAVSTSVVFKDRSLTQMFWGTDVLSLDSGFQGHMYTRPNDTLVVQVAGAGESIISRVKAALDVNCSIWRALTGIQLIPATGRIVLALPHPLQGVSGLPKNIICHVGGLLDAAVSEHRDRGGAFLASVLNESILKNIERCQSKFNYLLEQAHNTSWLMDKNSAIEMLHSKGVKCARTFIVNEESDLEQVLDSIPAAGRYVFKPAGGAAGVGLYTNDGRGASLQSIRTHLETLRNTGKLPRRFQIQEYVAGMPYGVTAYLSRNNSFRILEIHQQQINDAGRFIGGRWTADLQEQKIPFVRAVYKRLADMVHPYLSGLVCLDFIDDKVIEVNPRMTASAPIAHILRDYYRIAHYLEFDFRIEQIDINTNVPISFEFIYDGRLQGLIETFWKERRVLILPQGLNPFGGSRLLFINDDSHGAAQRAFLAEIGV